ncbi:class I SAM-dependent methyltransferase [Conexibacter woesei]|uniref:class I SAM-dependent methyltransferase n=1 Tax=Conexibacter woesei TaxID=191495 RepID=UPI000417DE3C|nr:methyltransferase domain-containing protein [Conexibacter woesei]
MIDETDPEEQRANARERWENAAPRWEDRVGGFLDGTLPLAHWMVDALAPQPGQRVLELAAGRGDVGFLAAELLQPGGELISTDGAEAMVEVARQRGEQLGLTNVEYKPMELEWVDAKLASLDGILCRHGYQHAVDPEAAFREARRVLKPGAKLVLAVWTTPEENPWLAAINTAAESLGLQEPAAPGAPGAFALSDPQRLADLLQDAGFDTPTITPIDLTFTAPASDAWFETLRAMSSSLQPLLDGLAPADHYKFRDAIDAIWAPFVNDDGSVAIPGRSLGAVAEA